MAIPPAVQQLLTFLKVPQDWVQHLIDENYACGCQSGVNANLSVFCEKWQSKVDLDSAKIQLQRAQKRYDDARLP